MAKTSTPKKSLKKMVLPAFLLKLPRGVAVLTGKCPRASLLLMAISLLGCGATPNAVVHVGNKVTLAGELWLSLDADGRNWDGIPPHLCLHEAIVVEGASGRKWVVKKLRLKQDTNTLRVCVPVLVTGVIESTGSGFELAFEGGIADDGYIKPIPGNTVEGVSIGIHGSRLVLLKEGKRTLFHSPGEWPVYAVLPSHNSDWRTGPIKPGDENGFGSGDYAELKRVLWHGTQENFRYLLLAVEGPTRPGDPNGPGGAGIERSMVWLKLDRHWKPVEEQHATYESYIGMGGENSWDKPQDGVNPLSESASRAGLFTAQVCVPTDPQDFGKECVYYSISFDPTHPSKGLLVKRKQAE